MKIPGIACAEQLLSLHCTELAYTELAEVSKSKYAEVLPELVEGSYCDCLRQAQAAV
jgi:hypothetical protein